MAVATDPATGVQYEDTMPAPEPVVAGPPSRAQRRRKLSMAERLQHAEQVAGKLQATNDVLVDLLNAIVLRDGGRIVIAAAYAHAATRQVLHLSWAPGNTHLVLHPEGTPALVAGEVYPQPGAPQTLRSRLHLPGGSRG